MRVSILKQIDEIQNNYCKTCTISVSSRWSEKHDYCINECNVGKMLQKHGDKLLSLSREKAKRILAKGENMTTNDIKYLLERGYFKKDIAKHMGLSNTRARHILRDINPRGMPETIRGPRPTPKPIMDLVFELADEGMTIDEIDALTDINTGTIRTYYSTWNKMQKDESNGLSD